MPCRVRKTAEIASRHHTPRTLHEVMYMDRRHLGWWPGERLLSAQAQLPAMDSEIERFRLDPEIRQRAAEVCARQGHELSDVLRQLVSHIAQEGVIPFEMPSLSPEASTPTFDDERLWGAMKPQLEAEVAIAVLDRFIADCSTSIDEAAAPQDDHSFLARLAQEREAARQLRARLDVTDRLAVQAVLEKYVPLVRRMVS